jgi:hypothetical protein
MMFAKIVGFEELIETKFMKGGKEFNIATDFPSRITVRIF